MLDSATLRTPTILETSLYVDDPDGVAEFYSKVLHGNVIERGGHLIALSFGPGQVLLVFKQGELYAADFGDRGSIPAESGYEGETHVAFAIDADDLDPWRARLETEGVEIESEMRWELGGISLYFRDPGRNLVELATPGLWSNY